MFECAEQRFSRFLPTSELTLINTSEDRRTVVSEEMRQVLAIADELCKRTDGLVDIGVGTAVCDWGYDRTYADVTNQDDVHEPELATAMGWRLDGHVVELLSDTCLDLGGIAKGWICDRVIEAGHATVASAGGDIRSSDPTLVVEVLDTNDVVAAELHVGIGALATSSRSKRRWRFGGVDAHHIIDPRTLRPAITPVVSASVIADTAAEAEAGAKAVLIRGVDGLRWADAQPWIRQAIVVWHDDNVYANAHRRAS
jgi:thiamine biosynthesis lipoprotein